jgi:hypothetical protein
VKTHLRFCIVLFLVFLPLVPPYYAVYTPVSFKFSPKHFPKNYVSILSLLRTVLTVHDYILALLSYLIISCDLFSDILVCILGIDVIYFFHVFISCLRMHLGGYVIMSHADTCTDTISIYLSLLSRFIFPRRYVSLRLV